MLSCGTITFKCRNCGGLYQFHWEDSYPRHTIRWLVRDIKSQLLYDRCPLCDVQQRDNWTLHDIYLYQGNQEEIVE